MSVAPVVTVLIVDTAAKLRDTTTVLLSSATVIAVDIEGRQLGRDGEIATVQLCASTSPDVVHVVDIAAIGGDVAFNAQNGLKTLLESPHVTKLFFDVRADCNALFFLHRVAIPSASLVDLQLVHVVFHMGSGNELPPFVTSLGKVLEYVSRTMPAVLDPAEHAHMVEIKEQTKAFFDPKQGGSYAVWFQRPLDPLLLEYMTDVRLFHRILDTLLPGQQQRAHRAALVAAVDRRVRLAHSSEYVPGDPVNRLVNDDAFLRDIHRNLDPTPKARLALDFAALDHALTKPFKNRIKEKMTGFRTLIEALDVYKGRGRTLADLGATAADLWAVTEYVAKTPQHFGPNREPLLKAAITSPHLLSVEQIGVIQTYLDNPDQGRGGGQQAGRGRGGHGGRGRGGRGGHGGNGQRGGRGGNNQ